MHIIAMGLNHKTAPVEIRERFTIREEDISLALTKYQQMKSILECVIVSTCNRTEFYAVVDQLHTGEHFTKSFIAQWFGIEREEFIHYLYTHKDDEAISHLFHVACGLDSLVLGETQILGQVRDAWQLAQRTGTTGTIFNTLFKQAVTLAKRAHSETHIGHSAVSVSYAAVELAKKIFGHFKDKSILILGAGKMGELTVKYLYELGVSKVMVLNRSKERAELLASKFSGESYTFEHLIPCLEKADIVISSTGAKELVVTKADVEPVLKQRKGRPLIMIDIAVPRDLDPAINDLDTVYLYNIDDLEGIVEANLKEREKEAEQIKVAIAQEVQEFKQWFTTLEMIPVIASLRQKALKIQEETMQSLERKIPHLSDRELKVIRKHMKSIVNQLLKDPILQLKEMSGKADSTKALDLVTKIFALEAYMENEREQKSVKAKEKKDDTDTEWLTSTQVPVRSV